MSDLISRAAAIDALKEEEYPCESDYDEGYMAALDKAVWIMEKWLPSAQPTLHGYNIEHLELIAIVLQKEDLPPERVVEALTDIGRIVAIVRDEFEETLRRSLQNIERRTDDLQ